MADPRSTSDRSRSHSPDVRSLDRRMDAMQHHFQSCIADLEGRLNFMDELLKRVSDENCSQRNQIRVLQAAVLNANRRIDELEAGPSGRPRWTPAGPPPATPAPRSTGVATTYSITVNGSAR